MLTSWDLVSVRYVILCYCVMVQTVVAEWNRSTDVVYLWKDMTQLYTSSTISDVIIQWWFDTCMWRVHQILHSVHLVQLHSTEYIVAQCLCVVVQDCM